VDCGRFWKCFKWGRIPSEQGTEFKVIFVRFKLGFLREAINTREFLLLRKLDKPAAAAEP